jgi:hypothetical protein
VNRLNRIINLLATKDKRDILDESRQVTRVLDYSRLKLENLSILTILTTIDINFSTSIYYSTRIHTTTEKLFLDIFESTIVDNCIFY